MTDHPEKPADAPPPRARAMPPAAERALREAEERRAANDRRQSQLAQNKELSGRGGLDPVRYEDWEIKGIASDF